MPSSPDKIDSDKDAEEWITVGGKKMRVDAGEDKEDITRDNMPSARGEKQANTKEAQKVYKKRFELIKTIFKTRDEVVFAEYMKAGIVAGLNGNKLNIMSEGRMYPVSKNSVFKKSELLGDRHWDTMTNVSRVQILKSFNLPTYYNKQNWGNLSIEIRQALIKNAAPAGTTTADAGIHNPIYNPINEEKSVSTTIDDEIKRQKDSPNHEDHEDGKDGKKDKSVD